MREDRGPSTPGYLPDALQGLKRPTGAPHTLFAMSSDFTRSATQIQDIRADLFTLLLQVHGPWEGPAEEAFHQDMSKRPGEFRFTAEGYRKAAAAIKDYAGALEHAQQTWDAAGRLADADQSRQAVLHSVVPRYEWDMFSPDRMRARSQVEAAWDWLRTAATRATGVLKALESTLPARPPSKPDIYRGKLHSMTQSWDEIREMAQADWDDWWELHKLFVPAEAKQAWKKQWEDFYDEWSGACSNPAGYSKDMIWDYINADEFQSGNYARGIAGMLYNLIGGPRKPIMHALRPKHTSDDERKSERAGAGNADERDVCHPLG